MCMCATALLKAKMFKAFAIYFSVYLLGKIKIGLNYFIFFNITCVIFTYVFYHSLVSINGFKLFKLVLVVYCDSCCHW